MDIRVGLGEDSHAFSAEQKILMLGGVAIPDSPGLAGNSDADPVLHALCNAFDVVGGEGSLSAYADEMCAQGITDSSAYVVHALSSAQKRGWGVVSVSISIEARRPRLEKYAAAMKKKMAELLGIEVENIGLTCTSGEGISGPGKGLGIRVSAVVLFVRRDKQ